MPNPDFSEVSTDKNGSSPALTEQKGGPHGKVNEKTASWGGLPGKTGPGRSGGTTKLKTFAKAEGI